MNRKQTNTRIAAWILAAMLAALPVRALGEALTAGDRGDEVQHLQQRLIDTGFLDDTADGVFGKKTEAAVLEFETALAESGYEGISADGKADSRTLELLDDGEAIERISTVQKGSRGAMVRRVQSKLIRLGLLSGSADGVFGSQTEAALLSFQESLIAQGAAGLEANGVADAATRGYLFGDLSGYKFNAPRYYDSADPLSLTPGNLYAEAAILIDADTGEVLFAKNENRKMYPASTTKIMTLLLAVEHGGLDTMVTVPDSAGTVPGDSSRVPVWPGERMPFRDLLYGLMIRSGNDAANAIATLIGGSVAAFVEQMNERASELGLTGTHYVNPHGYHDDGHYTTALDMAVLSYTALKNSKFRQIVSTHSYTMAATAKRQSLTLNNKYSILDETSQYYDPDAFGIKTGYTSKAGQCYVGAAARGGRTLICVVFKSGRKADKWVDAKRMFDYGFALYGV